MGRQAVGGDAAGVARLFPSGRLSRSIIWAGMCLTSSILQPGNPDRWRRGRLGHDKPARGSELVWVMFPRLGERRMVDISQPPPGFRDLEWVEFEALGVTEPNRGNPHPQENPGERWHLAPTDVTEIPVSGAKHYFLRRGGTLRNVTTTTASSPPPAGPQSRMSFQCGIAGSLRCSNHVEICCGTGQIVGNC